MPSNVARRATATGRPVATHEVVGEPLIGQRHPRLGDDCPAGGPRRRRTRSAAPRRSPRRRVRASSPRPRAAARSVGPGRAADRSQRGTCRLDVPCHQQQAIADILEPVRRQTRDEVGRLVVRRRRPDVRLPADRREQRPRPRPGGGRTPSGRPASGWPRRGSRTAPARSDRGAAASRPGRAGSRPGWHGPQPRGGVACGRSWRRSGDRARRSSRNRPTDRRRTVRRTPDDDLGPGSTRRTHMSRTIPLRRRGRAAAHRAACSGGTASTAAPASEAPASVAPAGGPRRHRRAPQARRPARRRPRPAP